jgi:hypothetical protein
MATPTGQPTQTTTLNLFVQQVGNYGYLALENLAVNGPGSATPVPNSTSPGPVAPPLNEPMLGTDATSVAPSLTPDDQAQTTARKAWAGFFLLIAARLNAQAPSAANALAAPVAVSVEAPSIDETDADWYAILQSDMTLTDPVEFKPGFSKPTSRYKRKFAPGDYLLIYDTGSFIDPDGIRLYRFEIVQLTNIASDGTWTVQRSTPGGSNTQAQFGTPKTTHRAGDGIPVYRLIDSFWNIVLNSPQTPQLKKLPWDAMTVPVVVARTANVSPITLNMVPVYDSNLGAVPGFRTLSGAMYTLGGDGTVGSVSIRRLTVAAWHTIRNIFAEWDTSPAAGGVTTLTVAYITPDRTQAYQVCTITIEDGKMQSYETSQQNARFPLSDTFTFLWPPNLGLPLMVGALDVNGKLQTGFTIDPHNTVFMEEDGELDFIVTAAPATVGVDLRVTVQT